MIPLIIAWLGKTAIRRMLKFREDIIFHIQDWISDCQFAAFISVEADAFEKIHEYMSFMDKLIKAYIFMIPLPLLVSYASDEMVKDPVLNAYFSQFPSVREHIKLIEAGAPYAFTGYHEELLDNYANMFPGGDKVVKKMKEEHANILDFFKLLWDALENYFIDIGEDPQSFTNHVLQDMGQSTYPAEFWHIPKELVWFLNPFIAIDWIMIKTAIQCYYSFEKYALNGELAKYPKPFIPGQWIWIENQGHVISKSELDSEGHFTIKGDITTDKLTDICINTHGLAYLREIMEIARRSKWFEYETNKWIEMDDTLTSQVSISTTLDFNSVTFIASQDEYQDTDDFFESPDVLLVIYEEDDRFKVNVYSVTGDYSNYYYYNDEPICYLDKEKPCHPWREDVEDHSPRCTFWIDKHTYERIK